VAARAALARVYAHGLNRWAWNVRPLSCCQLR